MESATSSLFPFLRAKFSSDGFPVAFWLIDLHAYCTNMTLNELKREAAILPSEERLRLSAFLKHLERVETPANRTELSRLNRTFETGDCVTLEQWRKMHTALEAEGL